MDKQKQIEEMVRIICGKYNNGGCEIDGYVCNLRCDSRIRAEICYEEGYRKIPENAVVLTREEYHKLKSLSTIEEITLGAVYENTRKETAEKICHKAKHDFVGFDKISLKRLYFIIKNNIGIELNEDIDEICKEFKEGE